MGQRQEVALASQAILNDQARLYAIQQMYVIHRIELSLKDDLEFELMKLMLPENTYTFLHALTALAGRKGAATTTLATPRMSVQSIIDILNVGFIVNNAILQGGKDFDYQKWAQEPEAKKLLATITAELMPIFTSIPALLDGVYITHAVDKASTEELEALLKEGQLEQTIYEWRSKRLEESIDFLKASHSMMVRKGVRD